MRKEYTNPEIKVTNFAAENICTLSGMSAAVEELSAQNGYATATVSFNDLITFTE